MASGVFRPSPWGPLNERSGHRSRTGSGHRTRRDAGAGARCRCEVRVQGALCKVTASSMFEQASLQRLSTRLTRKRGGGYFRIVLFSMLLAASGVSEIQASDLLTQSPGRTPSV